MASRLRDQMKRNLKRAGLGSHREADARPPDFHASVGVQVGDLPPRTIPNLDRLWIIILGTICLVRRGYASPGEVGSAVGRWSWPTQLNRLTYSIWDGV